MQSKVTLVNSNQNWSQKRRYKINTVVNYGTSIVQNTTGINSDPALLTDWIFLKSSSDTPYKNDFIADVTQQFTVPSGVNIKNVFLNGISPAGSSWSQSGNIVTVTTSIDGDLVTLTN